MTSFTTTMTTYLYGLPTTVTLYTDQGPVDYEVTDCFGRLEAHAKARAEHFDMQDRNDWPKLTGDYKLTQDGEVIYNSHDEG